MTKNTYSIVIVEDSPTQLEYMRYLLESKGWEVTGAENAEIALEKIPEATPDLIIVDYYLPGMHGDELCRKIRMNVNLRSLPILILTADNSKESEKHVLESGADDYLPKQVEEEVLLLRIESLLSKSVRTRKIFDSSRVESNNLLLALNDTPEYVDFLKRGLLEEGFHIDMASNTKEVLEQIKIKKIDCLLVDREMPDMDGIDFCQSIIENRYELENTPAMLMLSSQQDKNVMARALAAGADDFIDKTNELSVIKARIKALLRRKFIQDENKAIIEELKNKEIETERHRLEKEAAIAKAILAEKLEYTVVELEKEIKERKRIELELKEQKETLEKVNQELDSFTYTVSHDLKEPLRGIYTFSDFLIEDYSDKLDEDGKDYLNRLKKSAEHMSTLIDDLLSLSRITRVKNPFENTSSDILIREVLTRFDHLIKENNIELILEPGLPLIYCDPIKLKELFHNLISNAIKYNDNKKPIVEIGIEKNEKDMGNSVFFVQDNGIGIDKEHYKQIFEVFQRLHNRQEFGGGTGIGLAIVKKIIDEHNGKIWLKSEKGKGTTFFFSIPCQE